MALLPGPTVSSHALLMCGSMARASRLEHPQLAGDGSHLQRLALRTTALTAQPNGLQGHRYACHRNGRSSFRPTGSGPQQVILTLGRDTASPGSQGGALLAADRGVPEGIAPTPQHIRAGIIAYAAGDALCVPWEGRHQTTCAGRHWRSCPREATGSTTRTRWLACSRPPRIAPTRTAARLVRLHTTRSPYRSEESETASHQ
jgi:hypothetical protein